MGLISSRCAHVATVVKTDKWLQTVRGMEGYYQGETHIVRRGLRIHTTVWQSMHLRLNDVDTKKMKANLHGFGCSWFNNQRWLFEVYLIIDATNIVLRKRHLLPDQQLSEWIVYRGKHPEKEDEIKLTSGPLSGHIRRITNTYEASHISVPPSHST